MVSSRALLRASWDLFVVAAVLLAMGQHPSRAEARAETPRNGVWIAYSTAPAGNQTCCSGPLSGSDIFVVQPGLAPKLVAGRGSGSIWNVCPAFSPNGRLLAFGHKSPRGASIDVVAVSRYGTVVRHRIVRMTSKARGTYASCPMWSADGKRLAYLDTGGKVVVMTLDGAPRLPRAGDPVAKDFARLVESSPDGNTLVSPDGALVARNGPVRGLVVRRRDGSRERVIDPGCNCWIAGWSPDSRTLLLMDDTDGTHFTLIAVPVNAPAKAFRVVVGVEVNHPRLQHVGPWPGHGDVSWQPKP
jgi:WD40-like Beta Propeller Repeat